MLFVSWVASAQPVADGLSVRSWPGEASPYGCMASGAVRPHDPSAGGFRRAGTEDAVGYRSWVSGSDQTNSRSFDFVWRPKKAQVLRYKLSIDLKFEDSQTNLDADYVQRIRNLESKGAFDVESTTKNFRVMTDEATETLPDEPPTLEHFDAKGRRQTPPKDGDPFDEVMDATTLFQPPDAAVRVGEKWSKKLPKAKMDYRLLRLEKLSGVPILHIRFAYAESGGAKPVKSSGYFLIDARDFSLYSAEATVENAKVTADATAGEINVSLKRLQ